MPTAVEQKVVDPENELNNVQRMFKKLAPQCSVAQRALGMPQLAAQEKQLDILNGEMNETTLCISMATKGLHALRDGHVKQDLRATLEETEELASELRNQRAQLQEVNCLNYLSQKNLLALTKQVMSEADELAKVENALNRVKQIENRLEIATKRFCVVNYDNSQIRLEIHRLLVERDFFNIMWNRTITKLVKGKMYLLDIFEVAANAFADRDECCLKLEALKWKGLYGLNRDISEMQQFECELNHLTKLEEFLRVKGSRRICEADEKEERMRLVEIERCQSEIARLDALLNEIFAFTGLELVTEISNEFKATEILNYSTFKLLCKTLEESISNSSQVEKIQEMIVAQRVINEARTNRQDVHLVELRSELDKAKAKTQSVRDANAVIQNKILGFLKGVQELSRLAKCDISAIMPQLGKNADMNVWNFKKHLLILECEIKTLVQIAYGQVTPVQAAKGRKGAAAAKLVDDPHVEVLKPNHITKLVDYLPCAYCVEDYMMNLVFETPAEVATEEYVENIFHLEDVNTKFGIYSLTIPTKRHPYRAAK